MLFKTASILTTLVATSGLILVTAQPKPEPGNSGLNGVTPVQSLSGISNTRVGYTFALAPSAACETCLGNNLNMISQCHNISVTGGASNVSQLSGQEKACFCAWAKTSPSVWSQGCVSSTLCDQSTVDMLNTEVTSLQSQTCVTTAASTSGGASIARDATKLVAGSLAVIAVVATF